MYVILIARSSRRSGLRAGDFGLQSGKPSRESQENKNKMVALWKRIAEHYVGEQWVMRYDLLNEPNWNLPNGSALRSLYMQCTDNIRTVTSDHIIFIEGNWFANDFTGLTPPGRPTGILLFNIGAKMSLWTCSSSQPCVMNIIFDLRREKR